MTTDCRRNRQLVFNGRIVLIGGGERGNRPFMVAAAQALITVKEVACRGYQGRGVAGRER